MALVTAVAYFPDHMVQSTGSGISYNSMTLNSSGMKAAWVLRAPKAGSIRKVHWRTGTVTTPTDTDVRLETVSASDGTPTGTLLGTDTNGTALSASVTSNTWMTTTLTADAVVTQGQVLAVVIAPSGSPNYIVNRVTTMLNAGSSYTLVHSGASWGSFSAAAPVCALEYSDGSFEYLAAVYPFHAVSSSNIQNGTTPDEIALKMSIPFACVAHGFRALLTTNASGSFDVVLYNSAGVELASCSIDTDQTVTSGVYEMHGEFTTAATLEPGTYYLAIKPTAAVNVTVHYFDVASAAILDQIAGGSSVLWSQRTDAGAWSDTTTRRPFICLQLERLADSQGSGGPGLGLPTIGSIS